VTRIGFAVEGWRDRAFLRGLAERWCPGAELLEGSFRGSTGLSLRRELAKTCKELLHNRVSFIVILRDANLEEWKEAREREWERVPQDAKHCTVYGVAVRDIEDWLNADSAHLAKQLGIPEEELLHAKDATTVVDRVLGGRRTSEGEARIVAIVRGAPLGHWIQSSRSFEAFYQEARAMAQLSGTCQIPNERGP
jgi:hypothetical protein